MIFSPSQVCALRSSLDTELSAPFRLDDGGVWLGLVSSGRCTLAGHSTALAGAGSLLIAAGSATVIPVQPVHFVAVQLSGSAADLFARGLSAPFFVSSVHYPHFTEQLPLLCEGLLPAHRVSAVCYDLLCSLAQASPDSAPLPPLVASAIAAIRQNYAGLYGVEELSESLGVTKSHLVRSFSAAVGVTPGKYLTQVRLEAAKQLLMHREYPLDVIASLCGFSGANYLCRVFKAATGQTPAQWRAQNADAVAPAAPLAGEAEMYI